MTLIPNQPLLELDPTHQHADQAAPDAPETPAGQEEINVLEQPIGWQEPVYG